MNPLQSLGPVEWFFLLYFIATSGFYLFLNYLAVLQIFRHLEETALEKFAVRYTGLEPPITLLVPAYNEAKTIVTSVYSLLQLEYPEQEVVVINDGSTDDTLDVMIAEFEMEPSPEVYRRELESEPIRGIYKSRTHTNLRVIDKANGGKADALNAGINCAKFPLFCSIDADSFLDRQSLRRVVLPFIEDSRTVAVGGTVRIANGCTVDEGLVTSAGLPRTILPTLQIVEYLRAFLFGRLGWAHINSLLVISGAFGLFNRAAVVDAGGYSKDTIGEDMELTVRLHSRLRRAGTPYRITFVPEPICWTEVPTDFKTLRRQRARWQRGLSESLWRHRSLLFHPKGGTVGWIGMPFMMLFEWLSPVIEVAGYGYMIAGALTGRLDPEILAIFLAVAVGSGTLLSVMGLVLEEMSFRVYGDARQATRLFLAAVFENLGYRQVITFYRLIGMFQWLFGRRASWGEMNRSAPWSATDKKEASASTKV